MWTDFRQQAIRAKLKKVDAVLFTHEHSDHTAGLDDLRHFFFAKEIYQFMLKSV